MDMWDKLFAFAVPASLVICVLGLALAVWVSVHSIRVQFEAMYHCKKRNNRTAENCAGCPYQWKCWRDMATEWDDDEDELY